MELDIQHDQAHHRFLAVHEDRESRLDYEPVGEKTLNFRSTFVPEELRGRGIGGRIVRHALEYARDHGFRVVPTCWFVKDFIVANPRFQALVARE